MIRPLSASWALDLRSLALLRILYGLILVQDLAIRATDIVAHYTDWGLAPRDVVLQQAWFPTYISIHMANGTVGFMAVMFAVHALAALCMAIGYRTRVATFVSWFLLISLHGRNPMVLDGGDIYMRVVLFWAMFLPWGARWSVDSVRSRTDSDESWPLWFNAATVAYLFQICFVYWFAYESKTSPEWRSEGSAVYYAMMIDQLTSPPAALLLGHMALMRFLSFATLYFEAFGPFLLLMPVANGVLRTLGVLGIFSLHLGFGFFMYLGVFAEIGMASSLGLLPAWFWTTLLPRLGVGPERQEKVEHFFRWLSQKLEFLPGADPAGPRDLAPTANGLAAGLLIYVTLWNIATVRPHLYVPDGLARVLRLDQTWNMFAPKPLLEDGWYVIEGQLVDGTYVDLFRGGAPVSWDKPAHVASMYPNARWRKFMMNIWAKDLSNWRLPYGRWLTRDWNSHHAGGRQVKTFRIWFMLEKTLPDGKVAPVEKVLLWTHQCFDKKGDAPTDAATPAAATPGITPTPATSTPTPTAATPSS